MDKLIGLLTELTGGLTPATGTAPATLSELRALIAAIMIQNDAALLPVTTPVDDDPVMVEAARQGAGLAAERNAAGTRSRFRKVPYLENDRATERVSAAFGPFIDADAVLVQFRIVDVGTFLTVVTPSGDQADGDALVMLLPTETAAPPDLMNFTIPAGTVHVPAAILVPGATGFALLRISDGALNLGTPAQRATGNEVRLFPGTAWQLTVTPEAAPAATAEGPDGSAVAVTLPSQLFVSSEGRNGVFGPLGIAGFGTALSFETQAGAATLTDAAIIFPFKTAAEPWELAAHRSGLAALAGEGSVQLAFWALPLTQAGPGDHAEAAHGGMAGVVLTGALRVTVDGIRGGFELRDPSILLSASGLELRAASSGAAAGFDFSFWGEARGRVRFGSTFKGLVFHSDRGGADLVALTGGLLVNRWDLPLAATGTPFGFEGDLTRLTLVAEPGGLRRTAGQAGRLPDDEIHGLALENFFCEVTPVRQVGFAGSGARSGALTTGRARLLFDVRHGEPMLPDPYAGSWPLSPGPREIDPSPTESALAITFDWLPDAAPQMAARFNKPISMPPSAPIAAGEIAPELVGSFVQHLNAVDQDIGLLDLSTRQDQLGVAVGFQGSQPHVGEDNRIAVALNNVRLLMQPQVHWEPVQLPADAGGGLLESPSHGGRTLVGSNAVRLVPVLPAAVAAAITSPGSGNVAALFSLPFGLRALAFIDRVRLPAVAPVKAALRQETFDTGAVAARQLRLEARRLTPRGLVDPARKMPGTMRQTTPALPPSVASIVNGQTGVPLHSADLSGYGLSCFSNWHNEIVDFGVSKVRFDVMQGRTAYEVIQVRSVLAPCQARVVRTIIFERRNSGRVERYDGGWQAIDDGNFSRYVPFDKGVLRALRRIRQIRELSTAPIVLADKSEWQEVRFDADADLAGLIAGGGPTGAPALGHTGYVQTKSPFGVIPGSPADVPGRTGFRALFDVTGPIGGPVDCRIQLGDTLDMHLSSLLADFAAIPGFAAADERGLGFAVAAYGMPDLPSAGKWSAVRIDSLTSDISAIDAARGVPVSRVDGRLFFFRDPADVHLETAATDYGLLVTTPSSRVLFPKPTVDPGQPGRLSSDPPRIADPLALVQASGNFPRAAFTMAAREGAEFDISANNVWQLVDPNFSFEAPLADIASGGAWTLARTFADVPAGTLVPTPYKILLDSALPELPLKLAQPPHDIVLKIAGGELMRIAGEFAADSDLPAVMKDPKVVFGSLLDGLTEIVDALRSLTDIRLPLGVSVTVVPGVNPSFVVHLDLKFEIGTGEKGPIDIGLGKFAGSIELTGELQAAPTGDSRGRLKFTFGGAIQQAILPPLLYAGGLFHFAIEVRDTGDPLIELGLGTVTSIGGDLIKDLLEVEATIKYGYLLLPQTLQPGVMLGIQARALLLAGLFSVSFSADAVARITRLNGDKTVTIAARIRVAASIQVAFLFDEDVDFETQFEQNIPLAPLLIAGNVNPLVAIATSAVL